MTECDCGVGMMFWHDPRCALVQPRVECSFCGCTGYHALGCPQTQDLDS